MHLSTERFEYPPQDAFIRWKMRLSRKRRVQTVARCIYQISRRIYRVKDGFRRAKDAFIRSQDAFITQKMRLDD